MIKRIDRVLLRVPNLKSAIAYYQETLKLKLLREENAIASFDLEGGTELVLHTDPDRPFEEIYYLVDDVRDLHRRREELKLKFIEAPRQVARGWRAAVKDPFGIVLQIIDRTTGTTNTVEDAKAAVGLFAGVEMRIAVKKKALIAAYEKIARTADDLPYTPHFESLYNIYCTAFDIEKPTRQEVWRHLLNLRKSSHLPKIGEARSQPPEISIESRDQLRQLLGDNLGRRDRLPYSAEFDRLVDEFNTKQPRPISPHLVWRLIATLAK